MVTPRRVLPRGPRGIVLLVCIALFAPAALFAQEPPPEPGSTPPPRSNPPLRALFGSSETEPELTRGVDVTGSVFEVYDQNLLADAGDQSFAPRPEPNEHIVNAGFSYHPMLSELRPTVVTFEVGTAIVQAPVPTDVFQLTGQVRIVGSASVLHQAGRTWLLEGAFKRGTAFVEGLGAPVFVDAVSATANGFLNRRTDVLLSLSHSNGEPSLVGTITTFSTTSLNARVRVALSSRWALTYTRCSTAVRPCCWVSSS